MTKALKIFYFSLFFLLFFLVICPRAKAEIGLPKINKLVVENNIFLVGTAPWGSQVLFYLDGKFIGQADVKAEPENQPSFAFPYQPAEKLADGAHTLMAVAQDKTSLVMSAPSAEIKFTINALPAPTLIAPAADAITGETQPLLIGLTKSQTKVKIFIDNQLAGQTELLQHESGTANFASRAAFALNLGWHEVYALAEDKSGRLSQQSDIFRFKIELPMPAPTMFKPVVNASTSNSRPFMVGLAKNNSKIKIYIDKRFQGEFLVKNHPSGTANFAFQPEALTRGSYLVYAVAQDARGKTSILSNSINFSVKNSAIAQAAMEQNTGAVAGINEPQDKVSAEPVVISGSSGAVENKSSEKPAVENAGEKLNVGQGRGMINEGKENQSKLKTSLIIFILFLVGVVAWLLWVNRELARERQARAAEEKKEKAPEQEQDKLL